MVGAPAALRSLGAPCGAAGRRRRPWGWRGFRHSFLCVFVFLLGGSLLEGM